MFYQLEIIYQFIAWQFSNIARALLHNRSNIIYKHNKFYKSQFPSCQYQLPSLSDL